MSQKRKAVENEHHEAPRDLVDVLRLKATTLFVGLLMTVYSFFGSVYRIPVELEQQGKALTALTEKYEKVSLHVQDVERQLAVKEAAFSEITRNRSRIEAMEKVVSQQGNLQAELDRLALSTKEITKLLDLNAIKLVELSINVANLKESAAGTKQALDEIKRK